VHLVGFLFIVVIADARSHEPEIHTREFRRQIFSIYSTAGNFERIGQSLTWSAERRAVKQDQHFELLLQFVVVKIAICKAEIGDL
jgi:hypothetical protein